MAAYVIDGVRIEIVTVTPTDDVRFITQRRLVARTDTAAVAEVARRAAIVAARRGA